MGNDKYWEDKMAEQTGISTGISGLQEFMVQTFTWMALGLALTGAISFMTYSTPAIYEAIFSNSIVFWGLIIGELGLVIGFGIALKKEASAPILLAMFLGYAALNGLTLSVILFCVYYGVGGEHLFY